MMFFSEKRFLWGFSISCAGSGMCEMTNHSRLGIREQGP